LIQAETKRFVFLFQFFYLQKEEAGSQVIVSV